MTGRGRIVGWVLIGVAVVARLAFEIVAPLDHTASTALVYVRDAAMVAVALVGGALLVRAAARADSSGAEDPDSWAERIADRPWATIGVIAVVAGIGAGVFGGVALDQRPHVADEAAYLYQAEVFSDGRLVGPVLEPAEAYNVAFMATDDGRRYAGFFPGWSGVLALGVGVGAAHLVNPFLTVVLVGLVGWAGVRLRDPTTGVVAAVVAATAPFVWFQGASLMAHVATAVVVVPTVVAALAWAGPTRLPRQLSGVVVGAVVGFGVGLVVLARPMTALITAALAALWWLLTDWRSAPARLVGAAVGGIGPLVALGWVQDAQTGSATKTAHEVVLPDERIGLGIHTAENIAFNVVGLVVDLAGWPVLVVAAAVATVFGVARRRPGWGWLALDRRGLAVVWWAIGLTVAYGLYPYHGISYGPRFLFEAVPLLAVVVAGLAVAAARRWPAAVTQAVVAVAVVGLIGVGVSRAPFHRDRADALAYTDAVAAIAAVAGPTLVLVEEAPEDWGEPFVTAMVANGLDADGDVVWARAYDDETVAAVLAAHPDRYVIRMDLVARTITAQVR